MKIVATLLASILISASVVASPPRSVLSGPAQQHVTRVSEAFSALRKSPTSHAANSQSNHAFELLLKDKSSAGDEALAALIGHYLGDSTEAECEALARGKRMLPLLVRFNHRPPLVQLPLSTAHSRSELIAQIKAGVRCE
jgi:hypothetical protein